VFLHPCCDACVQLAPGGKIRCGRQFGSRIGPLSWMSATPKTGSIWYVSSQYFLADMGLLRTDLFDRRRRLPCGRLICLFMVPIRASLRPSRSRYVASTIAQAPPKSSSIRNEKLWRQHNAVGSRIRDDVSPMTRKEVERPPRADLGFVKVGRVLARSVHSLPAQPVDATQALNLSAGVSNCKVSRGRSLS
jgi:hypothetical protein